MLSSVPLLASLMSYLCSLTRNQIEEAEISSAAYRNKQAQTAGSVLASKLALGSHPKPDQMFREENSRIPKVVCGFTRCLAECGMFMIDPGQDCWYLEEPVYHLLKAEEQSQWKVTGVVLLLGAGVADGRFGKNEELDGFLEPVNLFDLVVNSGVCRTPAEAAGACLCVFALHR